MIDGTAIYNRIQADYQSVAHAHMFALPLDHLACRHSLHQRDRRQFMPTGMGISWHALGRRSVIGTPQMKTAKRKSTTKVVARKKQPSGAENRKRMRERRQQAIKAAGVTELVPQIGKLETASDWHAELADLYRRARCGALEKTEASKLAWIASEAAKLSRSVEELRELQSLREQLQRLHGGQLLESVHTDSQHQTIEG